MRKILLAAAAAVILGAGAMVSRSEAMPVGSDIRSAADAINPVEKTTCWRFGRFGWGWYPCGYYFGPRYYWGPRYSYYAPRPFYRHYWWR